MLSSAFQKQYVLLKVIIQSPQSNVSRCNSNDHYKPSSRFTVSVLSRDEHMNENYVPQLRLDEDTPEESLKLHLSKHNFMYSPGNKSRKLLRYHINEFQCEKCVLQKFVNAYILI